jgi:hypothetical protein
MGNTTYSITELSMVQYKQDAYDKAYPFAITFKTGEVLNQIDMSPLAFTRLRLALNQRNAPLYKEIEMIDANREKAAQINKNKEDIVCFAARKGLSPEKIIIELESFKPAFIRSDGKLSFYSSRSPYLPLIRDYVRLTVHRGEIDSMIGKILDENDKTPETMEFKEKFHNALQSYCTTLQKKVDNLKTASRL